MRIVVNYSSMPTRRARRSAMPRSFLALAGLAIAATAFGACREITGPAEPVTADAVEFIAAAPTVISVTPVDGATGVPTNTRPVIRFSELMDLASINTATVTLAPAGGGPSVPATISFHGLNRILFEQSAPLAPGTTYVLTITTAVRNAAGTPLETNFTASFSTLAPPGDITAPIVSGTTPAANAGNVAVGSSISATFSEAMNAATIGGTSLSLAPTSGGASIASNVGYSAATRTATLTPDAPLQFGTSYTLTVSTSVKDSAGNSLASPFTAAFTTIPAFDVTAPSVTSVNPANGASGVAAGTSVVVTFSEPMAAATVNTATFTLTPAAGGGAVTATATYNAGPGTATLVPSVALAYNAAYGVSVTSGATDVAGNGANPFASTFTTAAAPAIGAPTVIATNPADGATGVSLTASPVVTFSETMNLSSINSATVTLAPAGGGANIPVDITFHGLNRVLFDPIPSLAPGTTYILTVSTGVQDVAGTPFAPAFTSSFTTLAPADNTAPAIVTVTPASGATNVSPGAQVTVTFSETMSAATVSATTFTLAPTVGGAAIAATVSYNAANGFATLTPASALSNGTEYTVYVTSGATDVAGNPLIPFASAFSTVTAPVVVSPTVTAAAPVNGATGVATNISPLLTFSETMNLSTINNSTVTLAPSAGGADVPVIISFHGLNRVLFDPSPLLAAGTTYVLRVSTSVQNASGTPVAAPYTVTFTTLAPVDNTAPAVATVSPVSGAANVATNSTVRVTFSESMNASTISNASFTLVLTAGGAVSGGVSYDAVTRVATFTPIAALATSTSYTASVSTAVKDVAGNFLGSTFTSSFTTVALTDVTGPTVTASSPADRASEVSTASAVRITFNEPINPASLTASTFTVREISGDGPLVAGIRTYDAASNTAIFTPSAPLKNYRNYTVTVAPGVSDVAGNATTSPYRSCFTPTAGAGIAATLEQDHWAGNDACGEVHWHVPLARSGNTLTRAESCGFERINCNIAALSEAGRAVLGGASCGPTSFPLPRLCQVEVVSLNGTVNGTQVSFTFTTHNGLTFTFNGAFAASDTGTPWLVGTITGATMSPIGINWERQI